MNVNPLTLTVADMQSVNMTITVRYSGPLRVRFAIAKALLRLAAWLVGGKADVKRDDS